MDYLESRGIIPGNLKPELFNDLSHLEDPKEQRVEFLMRNPATNEFMGIQNRRIHPELHDGRKSQTKHGQHVGCFYDELDFSKPIKICE